MTGFSDTPGSTRCICVDAEKCLCTEGMEQHGMKSYDDGAEWAHNFQKDFGSAWYTYGRPFIFSFIAVIAAGMVSENARKK